MRFIKTFTVVVLAIAALITMSGAASSVETRTVKQTPYAFSVDNKCYRVGYVQVNHARGIYYTIDGVRVRQRRGTSFTRVRYPDGAQVLVEAHARKYRGWVLPNGWVTSWDLQVRPKPNYCCF